MVALPSGLLALSLYPYVGRLGGIRQLPENNLGEARGSPTTLADPSRHLPLNLDYGPGLNVGAWRSITVPARGRCPSDSWPHAHGSERTPSATTSGRGCCPG